MRADLLLWLVLHPLLRDRVADVASQDVRELHKPFVIELRDDEVVRVPVEWSLFRRMNASYPWERLKPLPPPSK